MKGKDMKGYIAIDADYYEVGATYKVPAPPNAKYFHLYFSLDKCCEANHITPHTHFYLVDAQGKDLEQMEDGGFATNLITIEKEVTGAAPIKRAAAVNEAPSLPASNLGSPKRSRDKRNKGDGNTGEHNTGDFNTGSCNKGSCNTGDHNKGSHNTGDCNNGWYNCGNNNKGQGNCGDFNVGGFNTGDCNEGHYNTGHFNLGFYNVGSWNIADYQTGCFNTTEESEGVRFFNHRTKMKMDEWMDSPAYQILINMPNEEEKRQDWWDNLEIIQKMRVKAIPNFNATIFKECTGIDVK